ncbi:uncharacterized protein LOC100678319 isoform X1 [Nasonia vitripennis]|uniref:Uncharacterized protein n=1 Tax=Nasonia vitripennis TaxID=7425 RepID=A0A7M7GG05_NASVI|nr:uncharacterized protein LOC100678319 isoform X1 [Nasonia vitripennis]
MTRILGTLLGVSFQTELLIMTLLGLANSTLDWKPFELVLRLNLIRDMHFSVDDVQLSNNFTSWIKRVLRVTVVVEFICSLLNPFAYILKLYPVITWSRPEILLPWLAVHAFNTILPKMLSVALAFVFYSENIISTMSLIEFLIVESVNLLVAWYNWYVFFAFYIDLREVTKKRIALKRSRGAKLPHNQIRESFNSLPEIYSSIPNIQQIIYDSSTTNSVNHKQLRVSRSLTSLMENSSQEVELDETSLTTTDSSYASPAEKSMRILSLTQEDLEDARLHKLRASSIFAAIVKLDEDKPIEDDSSESSVRDACSCSSSDEEEMQILASKQTQTRNFKRDDEGKDYFFKTDVRVKPKRKVTDRKVTDRSTQTRKKLDDSPINSDSAYFFLKRRFRALDKMCQALNFENQHILQNKWLLFRHELDANLRRHVFFKEPFPNSQPIDDNRPTQTETPPKVKRRNKDKSRKSSGILENQVIKSKWNYVSDAVGSPTEIFRKYYAEPTGIITNDKELAKNLNRKNRKSNASVLKSVRPMKWSEYTEKQRVRELRNLQAYNHWTLEQDRREMIQKKKKSKMTSYKKAMTELASYSAGRPDAELDDQSFERENLNNDENDFAKISVTKEENSLPEKSRTHCPSSMREIIESLDWSIRSNNDTPTRIRKKSNRHFVDNISRSSSSLDEQPQHRGIVDDETVSTLRSAFSYSDDSQRGFRLGPDSREPYPIFQVVAVTVAEILKATDWRNFTGVTSTIRTENEVEVQSTVNDVVFCGGGSSSKNTDSSTDTRIVERSSDDSEEIERRRNVSSFLLQELEGLLDSSRETLSAVEKLRIVAADSKELLAKRNAGRRSARRNSDRREKKSLIELFDHFYQKFVRHIERDASSIADFQRDFEKLTKTENFARFMSLITDDEATRAVASDDFDGGNESL